MCQPNIIYIYLYIGCQAELTHVFLFFMHASDKVSSVHVGKRIIFTVH